MSVTRILALNNVLTTIAAILILVLTALFTVPLLINWDDYRADFEVRLSEIVGSKVELDGRLNVRLLPTPFVSAENLRIGESGRSGKPVLEVKELTLWVAVPPLLKGVVEASRVTLEQPQLVLEFDKNGRPVFDDGKRANFKKRRKKATVQDAALSGFQLSPNLISLRNVLIKNGSVSLRAHSSHQGLRKGVKSSARAEKMRSLNFGDIEGVLSAITLTGPFYFNGKYLEELETVKRANFVRLSIGELTKASSTKQQPNQAIFPVQGKVRTPAIDRVVEFDGRVGAKGGAWFAKGAVKARLAGIGPAAGGDDKAASVSPKSLNDDTVHFTSKLHVVSHKVQFKDVLLRTGSVARPQTVKGQIEIDWKKELRLSGRADGQVIDLNRLLLATSSNVKAGQTFVAPAVGLSHLNDLLLTHGNRFEIIDFDAKVSQLFLGEGDVRDFSLQVKGREGLIRIETLDGRMAGNSRLSVSGDFIQEGEQPLFKGALFLRGLQFQDFLRWAVPSYQGEHKLGRGKYMLSGDLFSKGDVIHISDLQARLAQSSLRGGLSFLKKTQNGQADELRVSLRSGPIRIEDLFGQEIGLNELEKEFSHFIKSNKLEFKEGDLNKNSDGAGDKQGSDPQLKTVLDLTAQKVTFKDSVQRDVRLVWRHDARGSYIESLAGVSETGLRLSYETGQTAVLGEDKFFVEVLNAKALNQLLNLAGFEEADQISQTVGDVFYPLQFGVRRELSKEHTHYRFDGQVGGSDTAFSVFIPLEGAARQAGELTVLGGMESDNGVLLASKFLPISIDRQVSRDRFGSAKVSFTASGTTEKGFRGQVNLSNKFMKATYDGQFSLKGSGFASDGEVFISGAKSRDVLSLFGFETFASDDGEFRARGQFSKVEGGFALSDLKIAAGERTMIGTGLFHNQDGQGTVRLALATEKLDLQTLVGALQQRDSKLEGNNLSLSNQEQGASLVVLKNVWSDVPFQIGEAVEPAVENSEASMIGDYSIKANALTRIAILPLK